MKRKKRSVVWDIPDFERVVKNAKTYTEILKLVSLENKGGNIKTVQRRIKEENIDDSHIIRGNDHNKYRKIPPRLTIKEFIEKNCVKNGEYSARGRIKKRLLAEGIIENTCSNCCQKGTWDDKPLVMILDHINGVSNDHRIENLRMLCPNCNSQLPTHAGKTNKITHLCGCGKAKRKESVECRSCSTKNQPRKVKTRPDVDQLKKEIEETSYCAVGRKYGVSDNTIRKWIS